MALWQVMLGSVAGIVAGTAIGGCYYYMHIRYINKRPVRMLDVFGLLFTVRRRQASSGKVSPVVEARPQEVRSSVAVPVATVAARRPQEVPNTVAQPAVIVPKRTPQEVPNSVAVPAATVAVKKPHEGPNRCRRTGGNLSDEEASGDTIPC